MPWEKSNEGVLVTLPKSQVVIPREKHVPLPKPPTKWELFAKMKGIKPKTKEQRSKMVFDETTGEWVHKFGYKKPKTEEDSWIIEHKPGDGC